MGHELPQIFKEKYESLKGEVHFARDWSEAASAILAVCKKSGVSRVALGPLPGPLDQALDALWQDAGIEALAPPYNPADLPHALDKVELGITAADFAIAETGTLVEVTRDDAHRLVSSLPHTHIGVVLAATLVPRLEDASPRLRALLQEHEKDCTITFISGPSRTGDIEMILTLGVHGPEVAHAIVVENGHA